MKYFSYRPKSGTTSGTRCPHCGGRMYVKASADVTVINGRKWRLDGLVTENGVGVQCASCRAHATEPLADWAIKLEERT